MESLQFKTNINCSSCVAKVTPTLNEAIGQEKWNVDTTSPDKILTINTDEVTTNEVIAAVTRTGFKIQPLQ